jgi:AraC-like DNA-binding protein
LTSLPRQALADDLSGYVGFEEVAGRPVSRLEIGGPAPSLILAMGAEFEVELLSRSKDRSRTQVLFVPPAAGAVVVRHSGSIRCLEVGLTPWAAAAVLRLSPRDWPRHPVALTELSMDTEAGIQRAFSRLSAFPRCFAAADAYFGARIETAPREVPRELTWAWNELSRRSGQVAIADLATEIGWSRRHLIGRFRDWTGVNPKTLARSWRFQRARALLVNKTKSIAEVANICGYSDQSHLTREFKELGGCSPSTFCSMRFSDLPGLPAEATIR